MFKKLKRFSAFLAFALFLFYLSFAAVADKVPQKVPAAPNESEVIAKVLNFKVVDSLTLGINPKMNLYEFKLLIIQTKPSCREDACTAVDFLKDKVGKEITAYSKDILMVCKWCENTGHKETCNTQTGKTPSSRDICMFYAGDIEKGKTIKAWITYTGDEHGGKFWITKICLEDI